MRPFNLGISQSGVKGTTLTHTQFGSFKDFSELFMRVEDGVKDGSYFVRCDGTSRASVRNDLAHHAGVLILDCDAHIDTDTGEVFQYSENPKIISTALRGMGVNHFIYTSHSHTMKAPKCRVVIECCYSKGELRAVLKHVFNELKQRGVNLINVSENTIWGQPWYFPRCPLRLRNAYQIIRYFDGKPLCVEDCIDGQDVESTPDNIEIIHNKAPLQYVGNYGEISPIWAFNNVYPNPAEYLLTQGYVRKGSRMLHPNSQSGLAGLQLCDKCKDGVMRVYSHGSDKLNDGFAHDSFDCFRILEHDGDKGKAMFAVSNMIKCEGVSLHEYNANLKADFALQQIGGTV